jgi:hypothetical protein
LASTTLSVVPLLWWLADRARERAMIMLDHDPRLGTVYGPAFAFRDWIGVWFNNADAVALQHGVASLLVGLAAAAMVCLSSSWRAAGRTRATVALLGGLLPWTVVTDSPYHPERDLLEAALLAAYASCLGVGLLGPGSLGLRRTLLGLSAAWGLALLFWSVEWWVPIDLGAMVSTFPLIAWWAIAEARAAAEASATARHESGELA